LNCFGSCQVGLHTVVLNKVISYLTASVQQIDFPFPGYFTCGLVYNLWSFGGNRLTGLNRLSVILPRVMHISTAPLFTIFLNKVISYLTASVQQIDFPFPGYFTCGLVYNLWSFGGNRLTGLNRLSVILLRVMHISTSPLFTIFLMLVKPY
jgi:hypothetical protein